jgi:hypothetical protein
MVKVVVLKFTENKYILCVFIPLFDIHSVGFNCFCFEFFLSVFYSSWFVLNNVKHVYDTIKII